LRCCQEEKGVGIVNRKPECSMLALYFSLPTLL
jgi:hypothetical protein